MCAVCYADLLLDCMKMADSLIFFLSYPTEYHLFFLPEKALLCSLIKSFSSTVAHIYFFCAFDVDKF